MSVMKKRDSSQGEATNASAAKRNWRASDVVWAIALVGSILLAVLYWRYVRQGESGDRQEVLPFTWRESMPHKRPNETTPVSEALATVSRVNKSPGHTTATIVEELIGKAEPSRDNWESELYSTAAAAQLHKMESFIERLQDPTAKMPADIADENFSCSRLRPADTDKVFDDNRIVVRRATSPGGSQADESPEFQGDDALRSVLQEFAGKSTSVLSRKIHFKVVKIDLEDSTFVTQVRVDLQVKLAERMEQITARWLCRWTRPSDTANPTPKLQSIQVAAHEEVTLHMQGKPLFADCTGSALHKNEEGRRQVSLGNNYWAQRLSVLEVPGFFGHHGLAVGDVNGDHLDDLYVCDGGGLPNRLFLQQPDGTLRDASAKSGTNWLEASRSALLIDLDNDGDQDLVLSTIELLVFMENDGQGVFKLRGGHRAVADAHSMCAADFDGDGDLDIYVCSYENPNRATGFGVQGMVTVNPVPYNDANNGSANALLENRGNFSFIDVTAPCGLDHNNSRFSYAASWEDFDDDGDVDLYVANDFGRNNLYLNENSRFRNVAESAGVEDMASGMSVAWGDCNRDGRMDLYVGNMFSAAGGRITYQRRFEGSRSGSALAGLRRMARGNTLFLSKGNNTFEDTSLAAGVEMGRWAWGSEFVDLNNDGWLDIVVANGFVTNELDDDL